MRVIVPETWHVGMSLAILENALFPFLSAILPCRCETRVDSRLRVKPTRYHVVRASSAMFPRALRPRIREALCTNIRLPGKARASVASVFEARQANIAGSLLANV